MVCVTISQAWLFCLAGISPLPVQEAHGHEHSKRNKRNQWDKLQGEIKRGEKQIQPGGPKAFSAKRDTTRLFQLLLHKHISIFLLGTICKHWWYRKVGGGDLNQSFPVVAEQASTAVGQNFGPFPVTKLFVLCKILCKSGLIGRLEMGKLSVDSVQLLIYVCALDHHPVAFGHAVLADVLLKKCPEDTGGFIFLSMTGIRRGPDSPKQPQATMLPPTYDIVGMCLFRGGFSPHCASVPNKWMLKLSFICQLQMCSNGQQRPTAWCPSFISTCQRFVKSDVSNSISL